MKAEINIDMGSAAFEEDAAGELARILRLLAERMDADGIQGPPHREALRDINGNTVGHLVINR